MKSNSIMSCEVTGTVIAWSFKDGKKLSFDTAKSGPAVRAEAIVHGFRQKIGDAAAISVVDGKPATIETKRAAMEKVIANLNNDVWNGARESTGGILLDALVIVYPKKTRDALAAYLKPLSAAERLKIANSKSVKPTIEKLEAERTKGIDETELFKGLDAA